MKYTTLIFLFSSSLVLAQPNVEWSYNFGGSGDDRIAGVVQTSDGHYVVAGTTNSSDNDVSANNGIWDVWVAKVNAGGDVLWDHSYGGSIAEDAIDLISTVDGGFAIAGYANSSDGDVGGTNGVRDFWVLKLNSTGTLQWAETFGGSGDDRAYAIDQTSDDGFIVVGYTDSDDGDVTGQHGQDDVWVVKLNSGGALQWQKALGGSSYDEALSVQSTNDGGYILCGRTSSSDGDVSNNIGDYDVWLVKLDASGNIIWEKTIGGTSTDNGIKARQTNDGGYIVTANTWSEDTDVVGAHEDVEMWNVKLDANGNIDWQRPMGGWAGDYAGDVQQADDGGFISVGTTRSDDGDVSGTPSGYDVWMIKSDAMGQIEWEFTTGGGSTEDGYYLAPTMDGGYIIGGQTLSDDGDVPGNYGSRDLWLIKVEPEPVGIEEVPGSMLNVWPIPTHGELNINLPAQGKEVLLEVLDVFGRPCRIITLQASTTSISLAELPCGTYVVRALMPKGVVSKKIVLE